ncbi:unnamed protein product [Paramecium sonneborni]|uniref:Transmembrane protein n=1 Tax=Paramecium sonneborni TaxID=65129 RepID=A0A8S1RRA4_9CILI|nr:unnamed protein product [Paramecium sonneborni]
MNFLPKLKYDLIEYIINNLIIIKMFKQQTTKIYDFFIIHQQSLQNAPRIISIISNYYSIELKNLDFEEEESEQITFLVLFILIFLSCEQIINNIIQDYCDYYQKIPQINQQIKIQSYLFLWQRTKRELKLLKERNESRR